MASVQAILKGSLVFLLFSFTGSDLGMGRIPFLKGVILGIDSNGTGANKRTVFHDAEEDTIHTWKTSG